MNKYNFSLLLIVATISHLCNVSSAVALDRSALIKRWGYHEPALEQTILVRLAQKACGITVPVHIAGLPEQAQGQTINIKDEALLALGSTRNKELARAIAYHELAHAQFEDTILNFEIESGEITLDEALKRDDVQRALASIMVYAIKALDAFDKSNQVSQLLSQLVKLKGKQKILNSIDDLRDGDDIMDLYEIEEHRADLFAVRHLFNQGYYDAIVALIVDLLETELESELHTTSKITQVSSDMFFIRRILCIVGYLVDHNININKLFNESMLSGICHTLYELGPEFMPHSFESPHALR